MPTDMPLDTVISQVIAHTPPYVWVILLFITLLGLRQVVNHVVTTRRLTLVPVVLGAYSLWGTAAAFGPRVEVLALWATGMALAVAVNQPLAWPQEVQHLGDGRYAVQGSVWPLITMWAVFGVRYVTTVTLLMHPHWARGSSFGLAMPLVYGVLSGVLLARSLRILRSAPSVGQMRLA
jgi:hypothetical protein